MKIRILSNGNHYQILEEFVRYDIIIYQGRLFALDKNYPYELCDLDRLKSNLIDAEKKNWRSQERKTNFTNRIKEACDALVRIQREFIINELLQPNYNFDPLCLAC